MFSEKKRSEPALTTQHPSEQLRQPGRAQPQAPGAPLGAGFSRGDKGSPRRTRLSGSASVTAGERSAVTAPAPAPARRGWCRWPLCPAALRAASPGHRAGQGPGGSTERPRSLPGAPRGLRRSEAGARRAVPGFVAAPASRPDPGLAPGSAPGLGSVRALPTEPRASPADTQQ